MTLYVNGVKAAERLDSVWSVFSSSAPLWVGLQFDTPNAINFQGRIDDVSIYNYMLDDPNGDSDLADTRVSSHYAAAVPESASLAPVAVGITILARRRRRMTQNAK